jgi:hypothetical protein
MKKNERAFEEKWISAKANVTIQPDIALGIFRSKRKSTTDFSPLSSA